MKYLKEILHVLVYIVLYSLTFYIAGCLLIVGMFMLFLF